MIHKIQTSGASYISLEVRTVKWERCLCISKDASLLTFNYDQTKQLNTIIQSIDGGSHALKEYGSVRRWSGSFLSTTNSRKAGLDVRMIHLAWESVVANKVKQSQFSKAEVYKVVLSEFRGIKSFQIRERLQSPTYSGYGKQGLTLPTHKLKELQMHLKTVMQEFADTVSETR